MRRARWRGKMVDPGGIRTRADWNRALNGLYDRAGLSYMTLSVLCGGISVSTLQNMDTGHSVPTAPTVRALLTACGALARAVRRSGREGPGRAGRAFRGGAETGAGRWGLVVREDGQRPGAVTGLGPPAAESAAAGQVLVTTRLREAALAGSAWRVVEVPVFTAGAASAYLQAALGGREAPGQADALAGAPGMLPPALAQASAHHRHADSTV